MTDFKELYRQNLISTKKKVKESVTADQLIIQAVSNIVEIDRVINILAKRLRDWYELYNPEFSKSVFDHEKFVDSILEKKDPKSKDSMGADLGEEDLKPVLNLANQVKNLFQLRQEQEKYLEKTMQKSCPKLLELTGATIGAKLIARAGSLKHLAELPSSTIQVLGAEKALFRHMRTGAKPPKYGLIHEHRDVQKAEQKEKGKIARKLASKISIAVKVDYFRKK